MEVTLKNIPVFPDDLFAFEEDIVEEALFEEALFEEDALNDLSKLTQDTVLHMAASVHEFEALIVLLIS